MATSNKLIDIFRPPIDPQGQEQHRLHDAYHRHQAEVHRMLADQLQMLQARLDRNDDLSDLFHIAARLECDEQMERSIVRWRFVTKFVVFLIEPCAQDD